MNYLKKPEMVLFDVGGTLFIDGECIPRNGLAGLRKYALNPEACDDDTLAGLWNEYMDEVDVGLRSKYGAQLDIPLSSVLRYITMNAGLHFDIPVISQEEIFDRFNSERSVAQGIEQLLLALKKKGIRTAVISNNGMSGESLAVAIKRWIPSSEFEFCLTSADILLAKPHKSIFLAAASFAGVEAKNCWYCGDNKISDADGAKNSGMLPVLINPESPVPVSFSEDGDRGDNLTVNSWYELQKIINATEE